MKNYINFKSVYLIEISNRENIDSILNSDFRKCYTEWSRYYFPHIRPPHNVWP